jgi:hypothetical protein
MSMYHETRVPSRSLDMEGEVRRCTVRQNAGRAVPWRAARECFASFYRQGSSHVSHLLIYTTFAARIFMQNKEGNSTVPITGYLRTYLCLLSVREAGVHNPHGSDKHKELRPHFEAGHLPYVVSKVTPSKHPIFVKFSDGKTSSADSICDFPQEFPRDPF